jgi:hypothetical protein
VAGDRALIGGGVEDYGRVADAFRRNCAHRGEIGAACAVYRDRRKVVVLWGAYRHANARAGGSPMAGRPHRASRHDVLRPGSSLLVGGQAGRDLAGRQPVLDDQHSAGAATVVASRVTFVRVHRVA